MVEQGPSILANQWSRSDRNITLAVIGRLKIVIGIGMNHVYGEASDLCNCDLSHCKITISALRIYNRVGPHLCIYNRSNGLDRITL